MKHDDGESDDDDDDEDDDEDDDDEEEEGEEKVGAREGAEGTGYRPFGGLRVRTGRRAKHVDETSEIVEVAQVELG